VEWFRGSYGGASGGYGGDGELLDLFKQIVNMNSSSSSCSLSQLLAEVI